MPDLAEAPTLSLRKKPLAGLPIEQVDRALDLYNASKKGQIGLPEARAALCEIDPLLVGSDEWVQQKAYIGAKEVGGVPVVGTWGTRNNDVSALPHVVEWREPWDDRPSQLGRISINKICTDEMPYC